MAYYISGKGGPQRYIDTSQAVWGRWPMAGWPNCGGTMSGLGGWGCGCGGGGGCPRCGMSPCICGMRGLGTTVNEPGVPGGAGFAADTRTIPQPEPGQPLATPPPPGPITTSTPVVSELPPTDSTGPSVAPQVVPGLPPTLFGYDSKTVILGAGAALVAVYLLTRE